MNCSDSQTVTDGLHPQRACQIVREEARVCADQNPEDSQLALNNRLEIWQERLRALPMSHNR